MFWDDPNFEDPEGLFCFLKFLFHCIFCFVFLFHLCLVAAFFDFFSYVVSLLAIFLFKKIVAFLSFFKFFFHEFLFVFFDGKNATKRAKKSTAKISYHEMMRKKLLFRGCILFF
jgi:hypothetical protein